MDVVQSVNQPMQASVSPRETGKPSTFRAVIDNQTLRYIYSSLSTERLYWKHSLDLRLKVTQDLCTVFGAFVSLRGVELCVL
jgi:penicillin V acylase-like amidase (Ntn superfamily)